MYVFVFLFLEYLKFPVIHVFHVFLGLLGSLGFLGFLRFLELLGFLGLLGLLGALGFLGLLVFLGLLGIHVFLGFLVQLFTFCSSDYSPPLLGSGGWCGQRGERSLRGIPRHRLPAFRTTPFSSLTGQGKN